jgi:hypothetical protein
MKCFSYVSADTNKKALIYLFIKAFCVLNCTRSRDRTGTALLPLVFETSASTNSAIRANSDRSALPSGLRKVLQSLSLAVLQSGKSLA